MEYEINNGELRNAESHLQFPLDCFLHFFEAEKILLNNVQIDLSISFEAMIRSSCSNPCIWIRVSMKSYKF